MCLGNLHFFHFQHAVDFQKMFSHVPQDPLPSVFKKFSKNWDTYFAKRFSSTYPKYLPMLPPEFYPASTLLLSQPVSCISAMYQFGISNFQDMQTLTIDVLGADSYEVPAIQVWEEIMHCLPKIQHLTVHFYWPWRLQLSRSALFRVAHAQVWLLPPPVGHKDEAKVTVFLATPIMSTLKGISTRTKIQRQTLSSQLIRICRKST